MVFLGLAPSCGRQRGKGYGIEPLDWLMRRAHTKSPRKLTTRKDKDVPK
jgi:hypothetical protein